MKKDNRNVAGEIIHATLPPEPKMIGPKLARYMVDKDSVCAWGGGPSWYRGAKLPPGWRHIIVSAGVEPAEINNPAEIDGVLCPYHIGEFGKELKLGTRLLKAAAEVNL